MNSRVLAWICTAIASVPLAFAARQSSASQDAGQVVLNRACTVCHSISEITKFKGYYGRDQWTDVVRTMRADGAQLQDAEVQVLIDYLVTTYGKADLPEGEGKKILETSCGGCHDLQAATKLRLAKSGWQDLVGRMKGLGAALDDSQVPALVDYLTKNYGARNSVQ